MLTAAQKHRLENELQNDYMLPEVLALVKSASHFSLFKTKGIELRVIGHMSNLDKTLCQKVCRRVARLQRIFPTDPKDLTVWLFLTDAKRVLPESGHVHPRHINGGYTYLKGNEIFVLRREEFPKVVLHEVLHHTKVHISEWDPTALQKLYDTFNISADKCSSRMDTCSTRLEPNEAVVETWAEIMHLKFITEEYGVPFDSLYQRELEHAFQQSKKLLKHQERESPDWKEGTHSYSYIVLRTLLLLTFFEWSKRSYSTEALSDHLIRTFNTARVQQLIAKAKIKDNSLRMTLFGDF